MQISVIIPVYNAEKYLRTAVESALQQKEAAEVILVEDHSPDNSLEICKELEQLHEKVKLFRHPNSQNKGAGATRNLGVQKATCEWIAFLDADDYYLPERFSGVKEIIEKNKNIDGVYDAIGMHFYDSTSKKQWLSGGGELLTSIQRPVHPERLFESLVNRKNGYIHLDGLVVKKKLFETCGNFPENLKLHQDTAFILQLAAIAKLTPGNLETPVALRGIHSHNRITHNSKVAETKALLWETLSKWAIDKNLDSQKVFLIYKRHIEASYQLIKSKKLFRFNIFGCVIFLSRQFKSHPILFIRTATILLSQKYLKKAKSVSFY